MPYTVAIGTLLDQIRTAIGASTTVNGTTYTWARMVEGPALRWMDEAGDYPLICLDVGDTDVVDGADKDTHETPVTIHAVIKPSLDPAARVFTVVRELGEKLLNDVMSATARIGNERRLVSYGVDKDTMGDADAFNLGDFGVYRIVLGVQCWIEDRNP